jgi:hypothetical protein
MFSKNTILKFTFYFLIILFLIFVFNYIKNNTTVKETFENDNFDNSANFESTELFSLENDNFKSTETDLSNRNFLNAGYHSNINSNNKRTENLQLRPDPPVEKTKNSLVTKS